MLSRMASSAEGYEVVGRIQAAEIAGHHVMDVGFIGRDDGTAFNATAAVPVDDNGARAAPFAFYVV